MGDGNFHVIPLMKVEDPSYEDSSRKSRFFWCTIGGKIEEGEDELEAVKREVLEETGLENFKVGALAFYGEHTLKVNGVPVRHIEKYYLVYVSQALIHQKNLTDNERKVIRDMRWWPLQELLVTEEVFYPRSLALELEDVLRGGKIPREIVL